eukprot:TRINITY_DN102504_c0_g1_i2.p1 TRINITY_DN102504_c0_g1~~TRINITY_DN102504_c0_g1_i2.p1  ORF type:complete len:158 (-),score=34.35 TRINITY_DN102504_c0_g1_i2:30-503(-)
MRSIRDRVNDLPQRHREGVGLGSPVGQRDEDWTNTCLLQAFLACALGSQLAEADPGDDRAMVAAGGVAVPCAIAGEFIADVDVVDAPAGDVFAGASEGVGFAPAEAGEVEGVLKSLAIEKDVLGAGHAPVAEKDMQKKHQRRNKQKKKKKKKKEEDK